MQTQLDAIISVIYSQDTIHRKGLVLGDIIHYSRPGQTVLLLPRGNRYVAMTFERFIGHLVT